MRRILSMIGTTKNTPGPLAPVHRPRRKITPRSYSWTILIEFAKNTTSRNSSRTMIPPRASAIGGAYGERQAGRGRDGDLVTLGEPRRSAGRPARAGGD